jgi:hypothetical protein
MLSKKQQWRRQSCRKRRISVFSGIQENRLHERSFSETDLLFSSIEPKLNGLNKNWATTGNLLTSVEEKKLNEKVERKVRFCSAVTAVLIPCRVEYEESDLNELLWWNKEDFKEFQLSAISQIQKGMIMNKNLNPKDVLHLLYQPNQNVTAHESLVDADEEINRNEEYLKIEMEDNSKDCFMID